jgi:multicomponent Na+:H+ antiporter subunit G
VAEILAAACLLGGAFFSLVAAIGVARLPDLFTRMHAASKAGAFGVGLTMLGVAVWAADVGPVTRAIATIGFLVLTAPVGAHLLGRAAYRDGVPLWEHTLVDEKADATPALPRIPPAAPRARREASASRS